MSYLGTPIDTTNQFQSLSSKQFNGDASTTDFTLDIAPGSVNDIEVFVGNVRQDPHSAYTLSGTTLSFTGAPPSGTNNIYVVHQAKAVGTITPGANTVGVTELNLSDGSNGQAITTDGSGTLAFSTISGTTINNNADNRVITGSGTANTLEGEANLTYNGSNFGVNIASPTMIAGTGMHLTSSGSDCRFHISNNTVGDTANDGGYIFMGSDGTLGFLNKENAPNIFYTNGSERMRVQGDGKFFVGTQVDGVYNDSSGTGGFNFNPTSTVALAVNGARPLMLNRIGDGGTIAEFYQGGGFVGSISESGGTVSYNAFAGSHWSRLADNSKPTILRGTVMESISTLMDWYQVKFTVNVNGEDVIKKESIVLPSGKSVGDIIKHTYQGVEHDAEIIKESNERLPMCKISNTEDSKAVYGVFMDWDNNPNDEVNDMLVTALGAFVVRIHGDETVAIGDYLQSKGDGTAKKQADDILRASTIAKVTSTEKTHEYADGSYCVPCTLHCG
jgi:hypothetical protein